MHALSDSQLLRVIDEAEGSAPAEMALRLIAEASGIDRETLEHMSIGGRNGLLLQTRAARCGDTLACRVGCRSCGEQLEFSASTAALLDGSAPSGGEARFELLIGELTVQGRVPTSADLLALSATAALPVARAGLIGRCIERVSVRGDYVDVASLPKTAIEALEHEIRRRDPLVDVQFELVCPGCSHTWSAGLDVVMFVWQELAASAGRLIGEIHLLASAYGWREDDILAMSARRRRRYIERIEGA